MPWLRRYSPTKLCDGAQMANFCVLCLSASSVQHTSDLHSKFAYIMSGSMVDIQSATAEKLEIWRCKKEERKKKTELQNIMACPIGRPQ